MIVLYIQAFKGIKDVNAITEFASFIPFIMCVCVGGEGDLKHRKFDVL